MQPEQPEATEDELEEQDCAPEAAEPQYDPAEPETSEPEASEPAPIVRRWTVVVGRENQNIKMGDSVLYSDVAVVTITATDPTTAKLEARLALVRAVPATETDHWHALYVLAGWQELF